MNLEEILEQSLARVDQPVGNAEKAISRQRLTQFIAFHYLPFNALRNHLYGTTKPSNPLTGEARRIGDFLVAAKVLDYCKGLYQSPNDNDITRYLRGGWLEEYIFLCLREAGADECYYSLPIHWGDNNPPSCFEIDAAAYHADNVVFASCKTLNPWPKDGTSTQLRRFMSEALSWEHLFSQGRAKCLVVTTIEFIDRKRKTVRLSNLFEQAEYMNEVLVGMETLDWDQMVKLCGMLIQGAAMEEIAHTEYEMELHCC
ncbi:hypothetical protein F6A13_03430 [Acidithiobacillus sp. 'AMD consortium']|uniref:Card1-like endonuclease domain-containing protein n=1 Tax=Acidithiobacillus sp. 'AMD consortium' TaxID=2614801 RepID=UPI00124BD6C9|nr:DUF1887 family CARF protein [Acidithiobacillus sp. 'AMD consortium']QFG77791.1 hypothetical protein F6A13_03430 [Acidithiobacillus sp. 'AMD consortium']